MGRQTLATVMNKRTLILVMFVAVGAIAATGVITATAQNSATTTVQSDGDVSAPDPGNYTRLYVNDGYQNVELKPGASDTVTVSVENGEDEAVDLSPRVVTSPARNQPPVEPSWVSFESEDTTLEVVNRGSSTSPSTCRMMPKSATTEALSRSLTRCCSIPVGRHTRSTASQ